MEVFFKKRFLKDCKSLPNGLKKEVNKICFFIFPHLDNLAEFHKYPLRKMKGFRFYYRITIKDFRIGFKKVNNQIEFMRVLPRKDIYKFFP